MTVWEQVVEAGQRGITRLLRLEKDDIDIFEEARNFNPESGYKTLEVDANGFGVLYKGSEERFLHSPNFQVCSGIALSCPEEGFYAIAHMYSNRAHYPKSRESIESHARNGWRVFQSFLPPGMVFNAVSFGGVREFDGIPQELPDPEMVDKLFPYEQNYTNECPEYIAQGQMAAAASNWLADAFFEAAYNSGRLRDLHDFRYQMYGHHVLIDKSTGKIYFGKDGDGLNRKIISQTERKYSAYLFPDKGLFTETTAILHNPATNPF